jgi:hypothetical protein
MNPGFHLWMLKPKSSQSSGCTHIHQTNRKGLNKRSLPARKLMVCNCFLRQERSADGGIHATRDHNNVRRVLRNTNKKCLGPFRTKGFERWHIVWCFSMTMSVNIRLLALEHCWNFSTGSCLTTLLTALISLRATTICLPNWRFGGDQRTSAVMRSWWKVSKCGSTRQRQISLTQGYKKRIPRYEMRLNSGGDCAVKQF